MDKMHVHELVETAKSMFGQATTFGTHPNLYAGLDRASLGALDRAWVGWYEWFGNPILATFVGAVILHEIVYFGRSIPFIWMDSRPDLFLKYKIQPKQQISAAEQWHCTKVVLYNHFLVETPQMLAFQPMAAYVGMQTYQVPLPSWWTMAWQITAFFFVEDTWHYFAHRLFHWGPLYRNVHKMHHKYTAPFGLAAEYSHPIEIMLFGFGTVFGPLICCYFLGGMHLFTMYTWIAFRMLQAIDSHCGYDFPQISLHYWFPLWAGADHHDYHHQAFKACYASSFRHWDYLLNTEGNVHNVREAQKAEKLAKLAEKIPLRAKIE